MRDSPFGWGDVDVPTIEVLIEGARSGPRQGRLSTERVARWIKVAPVPNAPTVLYDSVCRIETVDGQAVAVDGDSGAVCVDDEGRAVALIVAAEDASHVAASAFAIPFWHIADKLGIRDQHIVVSVDVTR